MRRQNKKIRIKLVHQLQTTNQLPLEEQEKPEKTDGKPEKIDGKREKIDGKL